VSVDLLETLRYFPPSVLDLRRRAPQVMDYHVHHRCLLLLLPFQLFILLLKVMIREYLIYVLSIKIGSLAIASAAFMFVHTPSVEET